MTKPTLVLVMALLSVQSAATQVNPVEVSAEPAGGTTFALAFTLTSRTPKQLRVYESDLPWGNYSALRIFAVGQDGTVLTREGPIDDPTTRETIVAPGRSVRGVVPVEAQFRGLSAHAARMEVTIYWSYRFSAIGSSDSFVVGGGCVLRGSTIRCWNPR